MEASLNRIIAPLFAITACLAVSTALIAGAHAFERLGGMAPCLLCLDQREVHWTALGVGVLLLGLRQFGAARLVAAGLGALALVYLFSVGLAGFHAGVEWGLWPGPEACAPPSAADLAGVDTGSLLGSLDEPGPSGPSCAEAAWRLLGISMAGYNALVSLGLAALAAGACVLSARGMDRRAAAA